MTHDCDTLTRLLGELEWSIRDGYLEGHCPVCGNGEDGCFMGHSRDCWLAMYSNGPAMYREEK